MAYIYIAWDSNKPSICKVGRTKRSAQLRISETENPDYQLYKSYNVSNDVVDELEKEIHAYMSSYVTRIKHQATGRLSEWFNCSPEKAVEFVSDCIIRHLENQLVAVGSPSGIVTNSSVARNTQKSRALLKQELKMKLLQRVQGKSPTFVRETIQKK
ncbi:GIY-YIG nuclease family protein [Vibrio genomosp. F10]|uniref:GIY-YIG nuclease family protein n=1 Tax=Vibrio genomosp. F10 TaxID=723171 RepID=UPI0002EC395F|nr:GIY-YIG nuclease family protein [Vibrio genomosp. F10]OEF07245.1 hypothetical protein A1QI_17940 [Vibrio genomosp. F10 str. 9ZB36]